MAGAEADIARSITWGEAQTPRDENGLARWQTIEALILIKMNRLDEARAAIDESVRLHRLVFGLEHEWTLVAVRRQRAIHAGQVPD